MSRFFDFLGGWMVIPDHYSTRTIEAKYEHFRDHSIEYNRSLKTTTTFEKKGFCSHSPCNDVSNDTVSPQATYAVSRC